MATITRTSPRESARLRRALTSGSDQGPTDVMLGGTRNRGSMSEGMRYQDPTNVSFPFLRDMRRDHVVSMGLHFIMMPLIKANWYFEADDAKAAAFADNLIRPIYGPLVEAILRFLWAGYSPMVKNYKTVDPAWTYIKDGKKTPVWDNGGIEALVYKKIIPLKPESAAPLYNKDGSFKGIAADQRYGAGYYTIDGVRKPEIDLNHALWAVHDEMAEDGSPWGFPRIAHCAPIFYAYRLMHELMLRAFENSADPGPVVRYPSTEPDEIVNGQPVKASRKALRIGKSRRMGSVAALPSDVWTDFEDKPTGVYKWSIEYPKMETHFASIQDFIGHLEAAKLRALWIQEAGLIGGSGGQSSRNEAAEFGSKRDESQSVLMGQVIEFIMENLVRPAMAVNMPEYTGRLEMKTLGFGQDDEDVVRQIFQLSMQKDMSNFGIDVRRLAEVRGLPMLDFDEMKKQQADEAIRVTKQPAPEVNPTQGRRALVTASGFDERSGQLEMSYVQLGGNIGEVDEASTNEFLSELPQTDTFSDKAVRTTANDLRKEAKSFLYWSYNDFARHVQRANLEPDPELSEADLEEHFAGDKVNAIVKRVMSSWAPRQSRITEFTAKSRDYIGRVYNRTSTQQVKKLKPGASTRDIDKNAATWLDERGAELVSSVTDTTRKQLAELLSRGLRENKTNDQIASDIREHFTDFPQTRAQMIARTEVSMAFNYATIAAGVAAGVKKCQLIDGNEDAPCKKRNGKIVTLAEALKEKLAHPNCTLTVRLLPGASANLDIQIAELDGGALARYDKNHDVVLFSPKITEQQRAGYLIRLAEDFVEPVAVE